METKRKIEVFTAGCAVCDEAVALVKRIACSSCEVEVLKMSDKAVAARAKEYGIKRLPAIVVNGRLASCCDSKGINEASLRSAGLGVA